jgi:hypothetical protein
MRLIPGFYYGLRSIFSLHSLTQLLMRSVSLTIPLNYGTASGSDRILTLNNQYPQSRRIESRIRSLPLAVP